MADPKEVDMTQRTYFQRLRIRTWTFLSNWTERRLVAAYDQLVDRESDWSS
jgi:hypothetical protein